MSVELLLFLLVFFGPGGATIFSWDVAGVRGKRPQLSFIGWSFTISSCIYAALQALGLISINTLLDDGALDLELMVQTPNAALYLLLIAGGFVGGFAASLKFHSVGTQARIAKHMGRSWRESVWHGIAADLPNRWVQLVMENGDIWEGGIDVISPDLVEGVVALQRNPTLWRRYDEHSPYSTASISAEQVTIRLRDVVAFYAFPRDNDSESSCSPVVPEASSTQDPIQKTGA